MPFNMRFLLIKNYIVSALPWHVKELMYNDCNLTMLDIWDTDSDVDGVLRSTKKEP